MIYKVYKSLDNPSSLFGIKGSYIYYVGGGAIAGAVLGFIVGTLTVGFVGFLVFLLGLVLSYLGTMVFQARFSERERKKWLSRRSLPDIITVPPRRFSDLAADNYEKARKRTEVANGN